ncbi:hypothetical protein EPN90_02610 [Patescibacteria group bacterium]|nr:MAG: hypothetical protein EPN90_02610 [Patescibacteria group bacterium]
MVRRLERFLIAESETITGAALLIGASSLLSRFLGVLRERLLVSRFGVGDELDAYFASFQAPNFIFNLLILGTLSVALIPVFVDYYEKNRIQAWRVAGAIANAAALLVGALSLLLFVFAPQLTPFIAPGFTGEKLALAVTLTRIMAFSPLLFALSSVFGSVLNARRQFLATALAPVVYNLSIIAGIVLGARLWGIYAVAGGVLGGALLHVTLQYFAARAAGFRWIRGLELAQAGVRETWRLFFPRVWGIDISQISLLTGSIIGSTFTVGSVALFNLATNIQAVPVGVLGIPFAIAAFPSLAAASARGERQVFLDTFSRTARQIVFFLLPLAAMTVVLRAHVIRLVIGTQNLSWDDTRLAAAALALFAASFFLQGLTPLLSRAFYALKNTLTPVLVSGAAVLTFVVLSYAFLEFLRRDGQAVDSLVTLLRLRGVPDIRLLSLPLAFSAASLTQVLALAAVLRLKYGRLDGRRIAISILKTGTAALGALIITRLGLLLASFFAGDKTFLGLLFQTIVAAAFGGIGFLAAALALRSEEAEIFISSLRRKLVVAARPLGFADATDMR